MDDPHQNSPPVLNFLRNDLPGYLRVKLQPDLNAGLTVAMVAIPQGMAYAQLAGVPPIYGLYTIIVPTIIAASMGSSSFLITGTTNAMCLAIGSALMMYQRRPDYLEFAFMLAILTGIIRLAFGLLRLGGLMRFVSNSVLTGLLAAVATSIILNQLAPFFGIPRPSGTDLISILSGLATNIPHANLYAVFTGLFTMLVFLLFLWLSKESKRALPTSLMAIIAAAVLVHFAGWNHLGVKVVNDLGVIENAGLQFHIPSVPFAEIPPLLPNAMALSILGLLEAINMSKSIGLQANERIDNSREFISQGLASLAGGLFQCVPSSGSAARSAINYAAGAKTRMAGVFSGLLALLIITLFMPWIAYVPNSSLSGVLILSALGIFNREHIVLTWRSGGISRAVMLVTFLSALFLPFQYAVYVGVILSIVIYLYQSSRIHLQFLSRNDQGRYVEHPIEEIVYFQPGIVLLNVEGPLFFGAAEILENKVLELLKHDIRVIILRMRRVQVLGSTGIKTLDNLVRQARLSGAYILICGVQEENQRAIQASGFADRIGSEFVFPATPTLFDSTDKALEAAEELIRQKKNDD